MTSLESDLNQLLAKHDICKVMYVPGPDAFVFYAGYDRGWKLGLFKDRAEKILSQTFPLILSHAQVPMPLRLLCPDMFYVVSPENTALILERFTDIVAAMSDLTEFCNFSTHA